METLELIKLIVDVVLNSVGIVELIFVNELLIFVMLVLKYALVIRIDEALFATVVNEEEHNNLLKHLCNKNLENRKKRLILLYSV